jgi:hypothetical protein
VCAPSLLAVDTATHVHVHVHICCCGLGVQEGGVEEYVFIMSFRLGVALVLASCVRVSSHVGRSLGPDCGLSFNEILLHPGIQQRSESKRAVEMSYLTQAVAALQVPLPTHHALCPADNFIGRHRAGNVLLAPPYGWQTGAWRIRLGALFSS